MNYMGLSVIENIYKKYVYLRESIVSFIYIWDEKPISIRFIISGFLILGVYQLALSSGKYLFEFGSTIDVIFIFLLDVYLYWNP